MDTLNGLIARATAFVLVVVAGLITIDWTVATVKAPPEAVTGWMNDIIGIGRLFALASIGLVYLLVILAFGGMGLLIYYKIHLAQTERMDARARLLHAEGRAMPAPLSSPALMAPQQPERFLPLDLDQSSYRIEGPGDLARPPEYERRGSW